MWQLSAGMIMLGVALGFYWRHRYTVDLRTTRMRIIALLVAVAVVIISVVIPDSAVKIAFITLQAPALGFAITRV